MSNKIEHLFKKIKTFANYINKKQVIIIYDLCLAGEEGLEPPTDSFGDCNSTNCAIPLKASIF